MNATSTIRLMCPRCSRPGNEVLEDVVGRQGSEYVLSCGAVRPGLLPGLEQRIFIELVYQLEESAPALAGKVSALMGNLDSIDEKASGLTAAEATCVAGVLLGVEELRRHLPHVTHFLSAVVQHGTGAAA
jgi:hypothetical protein